MLQQQAAGRRIVLAIDDAHLLDPPSAALVHLVARAENATVVGTLRDGEQIPLPIRALWTDDLVEHVELTPMPPEETADLLAAILGGPVDAGSADRLGRLSAGNPLLLRELVHAANGSAELKRTYGIWRWTGRLELAPSLTDLIDTRVGKLTDGVRAVVELVAFGEPLGLHLLKQAAEQADVETAEERGLITVVQHDRRTNVRLAHPLYGEVMRRRCPVSRTRRLQAHLAELLEQVGKRRRDDLLRVAVWRLDSGTAQDPALLLDAAVQAFTRYDVPLATRLARAALDADGGYDAAELLATILMFADRPDEAIDVLDAVTPEPGDERRLCRWLTVRGMVSYWGLSRESTVEEIAEPGRAAQRLRRPGPGARLRGDHAPAPTGHDHRGAAQPTGTGPAGGRRRRPRAGPFHHRVRPGRAGRADPQRYGDRPGALGRGQLAHRHAVPPAGPGAGPGHPAHAHRRPGRDRRDRGRRVRRPRRSRRLPPRHRLPGHPPGVRGPAARAERRGHADLPGRLRGAGHESGLRRSGPGRTRPGGGAAR